MGRSTSDTATLVEVREVLVRCREQGVPFNEAWSSATADVKAGAHGYADALSSTKAAWRSAYVGQPTPLCGAWDLLLSSRRG